MAIYSGVNRSARAHADVRFIHRSKAQLLTAHTGAKE
jgi:hypothetical protein